MEGRVCTLDCVYGRKGVYTKLCVWKGRVFTLECVYSRVCVL